MAKTNKRSLADVGELFKHHTSDQQADRLLAFLRAFATAHKGATPTIDQMTRQLETVESVVRRLLSLLENRNAIHTISRNPLRIMVREKDALLPHEQGDRADAALHDTTRRDRYVEVEAVRQRLARFIGEFNDVHSRGPCLREMMTALGNSNGAWVSRAAEMLAEKGVIVFSQNGYDLSAQSRQLFRMPPKVQPLHQKPAPFPTPKPEEEKPVTITEKKPRTNRKPRQSPFERAKAVALYMRGQERIGRTGLEWKELSAALGYKISNSGGVANTIKVMREQGFLVTPALKQSHNTLILTDAGRDFADRLMVDANVRHAPVAPVKPRPVFIKSPEAKVEKTPAPEPRSAPASLATVSSAELAMELIERGYIVKKGSSND